MFDASTLTSTHISSVSEDFDYVPHFLSQPDAKQLFNDLLINTAWTQGEVTVFGRTHREPRLTCWVADEGINYKYSGKVNIATPWSKTLLHLKSTLEQFTSEQFNSVLINYYRDGQDSNGWHSDDEPELGEQPTIASVSLGATRDFKLRQKANHKCNYTLPLEHGSLFLMRHKSQSDWQHHLPKRANAESRINLTFRLIKE